MNTHEKSLAMFTRLSKLVVNNHVKVNNKNSYDYLGQLINNMQQINQSLMIAAIKIIKRLSDDNEANREQLIIEFKKIIHGSVSDYAHRA